MHYSYSAVEVLRDREQERAVVSASSFVAVCFVHALLDNTTRRKAQSMSRKKFNKSAHKTFDFLECETRTKFLYHDEANSIKRHLCRPTSVVTTPTPFSHATKTLQPLHLLLTFLQISARNITGLGVDSLVLVCRYRKSGLGTSVSISRSRRVRMGGRDQNRRV